MIIVKKHIIRLVSVFTILWSFLSCSSDIKESTLSDEVELSIGFKMATRATEGYEAGETYENYIDVAGGNYRIYFFDSNDLFIARFQPSGFIATEGSNYTKYDVLGSVSRSLVKNGNFKVVVIANWPIYPDDDEMIAGTTTIEDICTNENSQFELSTSLDDNRLIPFFGVREYNNITFKPDIATVLPAPITLLRAVAKVEVILQSEDNLSFSSVNVCRYNRKGYCAPIANTRNDYDHDGIWENDYAESLHLVNEKNDMDNTGSKVEEKTLNLECTKKWEENGNQFEKWVAYLTEYQNIDVEEGFCFIEAKFTHQLENDQPHKIYFAKYTDGQVNNDNDEDRLNVERNNIYRFNVKATPLQLLVSVEEWIYGGKVHIEM